MRVPVILGLCLVASGISQTVSNFTVLSSYNRPGTSQSSSGVWGWTSKSGKEYALLTSRTPGGVSVVDISTPATPKLVKFYPAGHNSAWFEVNGYQDVIYMVSQEASMGLFILDMSPLNAEPAGLPVATANNTLGFSTGHTLFCDGSVTPPLLWVTPGMQSMAVLNITNPMKPVLIKAFDPAGASHDFFSREGVAFHSTAGSTTNIWDVKDPANKKDLSTISGLSVSHNAWPSDDGKTLFTTEESVGKTLKAWNITDLTKPVKIAGGDWIGKTGVIAHNCYVTGNTLWVAHYSAGLWAVDITNPGAMKTLGFHKPSSSTATYGGTWGAYPFFKSGLVIHGDDEQGLFVLKPTWVTGIKGGYIASRFSISPLNKREIQLSLPNSGEYAMSIFTVAGDKIYSHSAIGNSGIQKVSLSEGLSNGNYLIKLSQNSHSFNGSIQIH